MNSKPPSASGAGPFAPGKLRKAHAFHAENSMTSVPGRRPIKLALAMAGLALTAFGAVANNLGENNVWQFGSSQDKVNKATALDQIEKKKAGYYDSIRPVYNYTTYIDRQINCSVSSFTSANTGTTSASASNSSPTVNNVGSTGASTDANSASNSLPDGSAGGVLNSGAGYAPASSLANSQTNSGSLASSVSGSSTSATTGAVTAGAGTSSQTLNSQQSNSGTLSASVADSTACSGPFN